MSYIISYVGAGGKTSSIYQDAAAFDKRREKSHDHNYNAYVCAKRPGVH